jgi:hypothetical protein
MTSVPGSLTERYGRFSVLLCFSFYGLFLFAEWAYQPWTGDFWEHAAVLRELSAHPLHPRHPVLDLDIPHPFFSPYLVVLGGVSHYIEFNYFSTLSCAGFINAALFLVGFYLSSQTYYPNSKFVVPIVGLALLTFLWPRGFLVWSGFYQFGTIGVVLSYPSTFAFSISCILIYYVYVWRAGANAWQALVIGLGTSVVMLTHPTTALFLLTAVAAIYVEELATRIKRGSAPLRSIIVIGIAAMLLGIGLAVAWPYFSIVAMVTGGDPDFNRTNATLYESFAGDRAGILPFIIAAPFVVIGGFTRLRRHSLDSLSVTFASLCVIYIAGFVFDKPIVGRVLSQIHMLSCLFMADGLRALFFGKGSRPLIGGLAGAVVLVIVLFLNWGNVQPLWWASRALAGQVAPWSRLAFLQEYVGPDEIVLVNAGMGNMVSAFAGRVIASDRPLQWVTDAAQRRQAVSSVLDADATFERRCRAMAAYRADFILVTPQERGSLKALKKLGIIVYEDETYTLIRVSTTASAAGSGGLAKPKAYEACEKP